jgi:signal transduction histidine kinase/CheY-like chemotaxis protein
MPEAIILLVDDDRTIIRLCQRLLERASYQVIAAMDPFDALKVLERQAVDLLLSDIRMPIMDGFELITQAKKLQPELPVLVMTGYGSVETAIQALHRGVDGLILKPFENSAELLQTVQRVLWESRQKRDAARLQALRPLFDVTEQLLAETSPQTLEKLILNTVTSLFQASFAGIYRVKPEIATLELVRTTEAQQQKMDPTLQQRLVEAALTNDLPVVINASGPGRSDVEQNLLHEAGDETVLVAPVRRNNSQFVFCACRAEGSALFTEADLEMFVILARQAAVALENARLYSELRDNIRRVEDSQRALIQAEKMAAVGRLMASLAHEINNPLQAVRNCLHLATRKGVDNDQHFRYLKMTDSELERLVTTVRRMLDFYRPGGVEKQKSDIHLIMGQVLGLVNPQLHQLGITVHQQYFGTNRPVYIVPDQIQQVIFNLMINAMDALEETVSDTKTRAEIWIDVYHESQKVRVVVEDSGPGIPVELRERIFEPFISTKKHGTGLGLAVSYGIMERHQGNLSLIFPRYGEGACFEVALPFGVEGENGKNIDC